MVTEGVSQPGLTFLIIWPLLTGYKFGEVANIFTRAISMHKGEIAEA